MLFFLTLSFSLIMSHPYGLSQSLLSMPPITSLSFNRPNHSIANCSSSLESTTDFLPNLFNYCQIAYATPSFLVISSHFPLSSLTPESSVFLFLLLFIYPKNNFTIVDFKEFKILHLSAAAYISLQCTRGFLDL